MLECMMMYDGVLRKNVRLCEMLECVMVCEVKICDGL